MVTFIKRKPVFNPLCANVSCDWQKVTGPKFGKNLSRLQLSLKCNIYLLLRDVSEMTLISHLASFRYLFTVRIFVYIFFFSRKRIIKEVL